MKQKYALICDNCHSYFKGALELNVPKSSGLSNVDFGSIDISIYAKCPNCKDSNLSYFFSVDNEIAPVIAELNKIEYVQTTFSCQGHCTGFTYNDKYQLNPNYDLPYVALKVNKQPITKSLINKFKKVGWTTVHINIPDTDLLSLKQTDINNIEEIQSAKRISFYLDEDIVDNYIYHILDTKYCGLSFNKKSMKLLTDDLNEFFKIQCEKLYKILRKE